MSDVPEDILSVRALELVQAVIDLYMQIFCAVQQHTNAVGDFSLTEERKHSFLRFIELSCQ